MIPDDDVRRLQERQWEHFDRVVEYSYAPDPSNTAVKSLLHAIDSAVKRGVLLAEIEDRVRAMKASTESTVAG